MTSDTITDARHNVVVLTDRGGKNSPEPELRFACIRLVRSLINNPDRLTVQDVTDVCNTIFFTRAATYQGVIYKLAAVHMCVSKILEEDDPVPMLLESILEDMDNLREVVS